MTNHQWKLFRKFKFMTMLPTALWIRPYSLVQHMRLDDAASLATKLCRFCGPRSQILQRRPLCALASLVSKTFDHSDKTNSSYEEYNTKKFIGSACEGCNHGIHLEGLIQMTLNKDQVVKGTFVGGMYREEDSQAYRHKVELTKGIERGKARLIQHVHLTLSLIFIPCYVYHALTHRTYQIIAKAHRRAQK